MSENLSAAERFQFEDEIRRFQEGKSDEGRFREIRRVMGIFEGRVAGTYSVRIRPPGGRLTAVQLSVTADVADSFGNGNIHVTARQELTLHAIPLKHLIPALRQLIAFGLFTRGAGGPTVLNITACPGRGYCEDPLFDVEPFARQLSEKLILETERFALPRRFKIAISACPDDCAEAGVADVGFMARTDPAGRRGFQMLAGGGLTAGMVGFQVEEFLPGGELYLAFAAIRSAYKILLEHSALRVSRPGVVIRNAGEAVVQQLYRSEKENLREAIPWPLNPLPDLPDGKSEFAENSNPGSLQYQIWKKYASRPQAEEGKFAVTVAVKCGEITSYAAWELASYLWERKMNDIRLTPGQNLLIPRVPADMLPDFHSMLNSIQLAPGVPGPLMNMRVCSGSQSCKSGVCRPKTVALELLKLAGRPYWFHPALRHLTIRLSGCHNECGHPSTAVLGFVGIAERDGENEYPAYEVLWGGKAHGVDTVFGGLAGTLSAMYVAPMADAFLERLAKILPEEADAAQVVRAGRLILGTFVTEFRSGQASPDPSKFSGWGDLKPVSAS